MHHQKNFSRKAFIIFSHCIFISAYSSLHIQPPKTVPRKSSWLKENQSSNLQWSKKHPHFLSIPIHETKQSQEIFNKLFWRIFEKEDSKNFLTEKNILIADLFSQWLKECCEKERPHVSSLNYSGGLQDCKDLIDQACCPHEQNISDLYIEGFMNFFYNGIKSHGLFYVTKGHIIGIGFNSGTVQKPAIFYGALKKKSSPLDLHFFKDIIVYQNFQIQNKH